jgi:hypothetical protein
VYRNFIIACLLACWCYEMGVLIGGAPYQNQSAVIVPDGYVERVERVKRAERLEPPPGYVWATEENVKRVLQSIGVH